MEILILIVVLLAIAGYGTMLYNRLVRRRNASENAFHQIDVQLKYRHDLIPNLVETVKGYASHERETLNEVIEARNKAEEIRSQAGSAGASAATMGELGRAEGELGGALGRLFALSEAYPDLKANENFRDLQETLTSTERKVSSARRAYNNAVMEYNNTVQTVPSNMIANMFNFTLATPLEFEDREEIQQAPQVSFS